MEYIAVFFAFITIALYLYEYQQNVESLIPHRADELILNENLFTPDMNNEKIAFQVYKYVSVYSLVEKKWILRR